MSLTIPTRSRRLALVALASVGVAGVTGGITSDADAASKLKLKKNQVTSKHIKNGTVGSQDLTKGLKATLSQLSAKTLAGVVDGTVTSAKLADAAVTSQKIADAAITTAKLADDAVTNPKLADDAVTGAEVAPNSLTDGDLAPNSVGASELKAEAVSGAKINDGTLSMKDVAGATGTVSLNFGSISPGSCQGSSDFPTGNSMAGDFLDVQPAYGWPVELQVEAYQHGSAISSHMYVVACNHSANAINPDATDFSWAVIENA